MTDQEKNEEIARKLGNVPIHMHDPDPGQLWGPKKECFCDIPDYLNDIRAAWEIVEKYEINIRRILAIPADKESFWYYQAEICLGIYAEDWITAKADTASRAICEAFLKLP